MTHPAFENRFATADNPAWEIVGEGVKRKIMAYDATLMMVLVAFDTGGIGAAHRHEHTQASYVESGRFVITIDGTERTLGAGDAYFIPANVWHGAVCLEAGTLVDVFTPMRTDFV
ncbi:cupin domain-containing protein [Fibrella aquatilis]|uniref:Cupin domain-containing protein n=1 Tax=Fibrella aquatilis TaxID=2817059 RepID=A0A939G558_9BACT|nr:cupin domain-containing protein [Fibrella aquatilis]MBO0931235.1 cupin domain-containing protein [Fibrella aquatilis]